MPLVLLHACWRISSVPISKKDCIGPVKLSMLDSSADAPSVSRLCTSSWSSSLKHWGCIRWSALDCSPLFCWSSALKYVFAVLITVVPKTNTAVPHSGLLGDSQEIRCCWNFDCCQIILQWLKIFTKKVTKMHAISEKWRRVSELLFTARVLCFHKRSKVLQLVFYTKKGVSWQWIAWPSDYLIKKCN